MRSFVYVAVFVRKKYNTHILMLQLWQLSHLPHNFNQLTILYSSAKFNNPKHWVTYKIYTNIDIKPENGDIYL